jgi:hypothetical protein
MYKYRKSFMNHNGKGAGSLLIAAVTLGVGFTLGAGLMKAGVKYANKFSGNKFPPEVAQSFRASRNWYLYDYQLPA